MPYRNLWLFALIFGPIYTIARPAHAYLDPGSISMFVSFLVAGVVGALAFVRFHWYKLKNHIVARRNKEKVE